MVTSPQTLGRLDSHLVLILASRFARPNAANAFVVGILQLTKRHPGALNLDPYVPTEVHVRCLTRCSRFDGVILASCSPSPDTDIDKDKVPHPDASMPRSFRPALLALCGGLSLGEPKNLRLRESMCFSCLRVSVSPAPVGPPLGLR